METSEPASASAASGHPLDLPCLARPLPQLINAAEVGTTTPAVLTNGFVHAAASAGEGEEEEDWEEEGWEEEVVPGSSPALAILEEAAEPAPEEDKGGWLSNLFGGLFGSRK